MNPSKAIRADWICPVSAPPLRDGIILIEDGRILEIAQEAPNGVPVESFEGCAIIPGFVNTHVHLELTVLRGFLENLPFFEWIRTLTEAKYKHLTSEDLLCSARLGAIECLEAGVTAVGEVTDLGAGWSAINEFGLSGVAYQEVFGPSEDVAPDALRALIDKVNAMRGNESPTCRVGVSPHAPYSVSANSVPRGL